jgi:hypothetical protein
MAPLAELVTVGGVYVATLSVLFGLRLLLTIRHTLLP